MKYYNKKIEIDGIKFDSIKEYKRYLFLLNAQSNGDISELKLQPSFDLLPAQYLREVCQLKTKTIHKLKLLERPVVYIADFSYMKNGELIVEDVKISKKLLPTEYILKRKMLLFFYSIQVRQVFNAEEPI